MKTTLELPDELMHAIKLRAAVTNRKMKDVVADAITSGLAAPSRASNPRSNARGKPTAARRRAARPAAKLDPMLEALFVEGDAMTAAGVDFKAWAARSRDVWR
jgi:plasmid stability protein